MDLLLILLSDSFWVATLRIASPLIFGVLGALLCERVGVLNLGIEGIFVAGAMSGWLAVWFGLDLWIGVLIAALAGASIGFLHALLTVLLGLSQHVVGLGLTLLATSSAYFGFRTALPDLDSPPRIIPFQPLQLPFLSDLPFIGPVLFQQTALTWLALFLVVAIAYLLNRTPLGVAMLAVGDNPDAVDAQGLSVYALRVAAVTIGSAIMALGGAFLTMSSFDTFFFGMVNGRGWICIALVIFAGWKPGKALLGALLFAACDAYQVRLQAEVGAFVPTQLFLMAPYLISIIALVLVTRKANYPRALLTPWFKGQR